MESGGLDGTAFKSGELEEGAVPFFGDGGSRLDAGECRLRDHSGLVIVIQCEIREMIMDERRTSTLFLNVSKSGLRRFFKNVGFMIVDMTV